MPIGGNTTTNGDVSAVVEIDGGRKSITIVGAPLSRIDESDFMIVSVRATAIGR